MPYARSLPALAATLAIAAAIAAPAHPVPAPAGAAALREAQGLSRDWGRCPTARPAWRALSVARHAPPARRAAAARRARDAWRDVRDACTVPVPMPVALPGAEVPTNGT